MHSNNLGLNLSLFLKKETVITAEFRQLKYSKVHNRGDWLFEKCCSSQFMTSFILTLLSISCKCFNVLKPVYSFVNGP